MRERRVEQERSRGWPSAHEGRGQGRERRREAKGEGQRGVTWDKLTQNSWKGEKEERDGGVSWLLGCPWSLSQKVETQGIFGQEEGGR